MKRGKIIKTAEEVDRGERERDVCTFHFDLVVGDMRLPFPLSSRVFRPFINNDSSDGT